MSRPDGYDGDRGPAPRSRQPQWWTDRTSDSLTQRVPPQPNRRVAHGPPQRIPEGGSAERPELRPKRFGLRRWLIAIGVVVIVGEGVALLLGAGRLGVFGGAQLDVTKVQAGVQKILSDPVYGYGGHDVSSVSCNDGHNPSADKGDSFTCTVVLDGNPAHVTVVVEDDEGTYSVDRPH